MESYPRRAKVRNRAEGRKGRLMPSSVVLTLRKTAKGEAAESGGGAEVGQPPMYPLAEGRIGTTGKTVSRTINGAGTTVPWIWSVTKFDASGVATTTDHAIFPTYSVYKDGARIALYPQMQSNMNAFIGKDATYQRLESQIK